MQQQHRRVVAALAAVLVVVAAPAVEPAPAAAATVKPIHFPMGAAATFRPDFGEPRDGGARSHQGVDLFAPKLTHVVAAVDGTVTKVVTGTARAGNQVTLRGADGWTYLYIHLNNDTPGTDDGANPREWMLAPGIGVGSRVRAGQHLGYNGDSGNAEEEAPQLHFEIRTPANVPIDPWPSLRAARGIPYGTRCDVDRTPARTPDADAGPGLWQLGADGGVFSHGDAPFHGSLGDRPLNRPPLAMAALSDGSGYWFTADDGGVFAFGAAPFHGSTGGMVLNRPVVGMAARGDGSGYWLVASDGGVFSFGAAPFHGSTGDVRLNRPVVGMAARGDGSGYWLLADDGGVFAFGAAGFHGSVPGTGVCWTYRAVAIAATSTGQGYWVATDDGRVWPFGDAADHGDSRRMGITTPVAGMAARAGAAG